MFCNDGQFLKFCSEVDRVSRSTTFRWVEVHNPHFSWVGDVLIKICCVKMCDERFILIELIRKLQVCNKNNKNWIEKKDKIYLLIKNSNFCSYWAISSFTNLKQNDEINHNFYFSYQQLVTLNFRKFIWPISLQFATLCKQNVWNFCLWKHFLEIPMKFFSHVLKCIARSFTRVLVKVANILANI